MAVKATAEITLRDQTDAEALILWHYVSTSATKPNKPNTTSASATPSGWSKSEPSVSSDSDLSKYDYTSLQTVWGDGTCDWGDVNLSASYEAAKRAWNKVGSVESQLNNLEIGGRNLLGNTENRSGSEIVSNAVSTSTFGSIGNYNDSVSLYSLVNYDASSNAVSCATSTSTGNRGAGWFTKAGEIRAGESYTFSCRIKCSIATNIHMHTAWRNGSETATYTGWTAEGTKAIVADTWTDYSCTFTPNANAKLTWEFFVAICITGSSSGATYQIAHAKLERGNKATDWSPAPEDVTYDINTVSTAMSEANEGLADSIAEVSKSLEEANTRITNLANAVADADADRAKWVQVDSENGITIGAVDSSYNLVLDNNSVDFMVGDQLAATASIDAFIPTALRLGDYVLSGSGGYLYIDYQPLQTQ